jgi:hypothetical protein
MTPFVLAVSVLTFAQEPDYGRDVLPILSDNCFYCHGPDAKRRKADLRLDDEASAKRRPKEGSPAIVPGKSAESELVRRILTEDRDDLMPPPKSNKKLTASQITTLRNWIDAGAKWGRHWSFTPLEKPAVPPGTAHPVDAFINARLAAEKIPPAPPAPKHVLLRRLSLDLTGLPPTPEELDAFLADTAPGAVERLVDRLFASPRYGERMAWDWMEVSRYADSNGYQGDGERTMWPWRDWVVRAFNENLPYDRFTQWQLAGDLLPEGPRDARLATGFLRNHPINGEGGRIAEENRVEYVMDMTETVGAVWLGLTFTCARCHDHKFDPVSKRDYYSIFAFFNQTPVNGGGGDPQTAPVLELATPEQSARVAQTEAAHAAAAAEVAGFEFTEGALDPVLLEHPKLKDLVKPEAAKRDRGKLDEILKAFDKLAPDYVKLVRTLREAVDQRSAARKAVPRVMVMEDLPKPRKTYILDKGLYDKRQDEVGAATPASFPALPPGAPPNRLGLAQWLMARDNPLPARVTVNRYWQMLFGIGLAKTTEDLGSRGEFPVHRELLDWLAADFRDSGWNVNRLLRLIVTSAAYQRSSNVPPGMAERDPMNRLHARGPRFRLPSWMIRDQALAASGLMTGTIGGPPVKPYQPKGIWEEATFGTKTYAQDRGEALYRRSLYVFWRRIVGPTMFFDTQSRSTCVVKPARTNTPLHALATLNDPTYVEAARVLAERALKCPTDAERLASACRRVLAREPSVAERDVLLAGLARRRAEFAARPEDAKLLLKVGESKRDESLDPVDHAAWTAVALTILNLDEAVTRE